MKIKMKQLFGIILSLVLALGLMPGMSMIALAADQPTVTCEPVEGGRVIVERSATDSNKWNLTAVPNEGYDLSGWYEWGGTVSNNPNRYKLDNMTDSDLQNITCKFSPVYTVTFKVVGGTWSDGTTADKTETVMLYHRPENVPTGMVVATGYTGEGSWDLDPLDYSTPSIREDTTFTYIFDEKPSISETVTFKVTNGSWDDGTTADKTVIVKCYEGDTLKLSAEQIPAVGTKPNEGYKAGSWDVTPSADTVISKATTYTYTYEADSSGGSSDNTNTTTDTSAKVPYDSVPISTGAVTDITGTAAATAERNPCGTKIENNSNLTTLLSLTDAEVAQGVNVWLDVQDMSASVPQTDKTLIQNTSGDYTVGLYLDINLFKKVGSNDATKVTETNGKIKASIVIPKKLRKSGRTFEIIRVHNGKAATITGKYTKKTHLFTFETDKFSTYAIAYKDAASSTDSESTDSSSSATTSTTTTASTGSTATTATAPKTGDASDMRVWLMLVMVCLGGFGVLVLSKKKEN